MPWRCGRRRTRTSSGWPWRRASGGRLVSSRVLVGFGLPWLLTLTLARARRKSSAGLVRSFGACCARPGAVSLLAPSCEARGRIRAASAGELAASIGSGVRTARPRPGQRASRSRRCAGASSASSRNKIRGNVRTSFPWRGECLLCAPMKRSPLGFLGLSLLSFSLGCGGSVPGTGGTGGGGAAGADVGGSGGSGGDGGAAGACAELAPSCAAFDDGACSGPTGGELSGRCAIAFGSELANVITCGAGEAVPDGCGSLSEYSPGLAVECSGAAVVVLCCCAGAGGS